MPIIEIGGVGRVEVDDSFLSLDPAEQERTINQIVAQSRGRPNANPRAPAPQAAPAAPVVAGDQLDSPTDIDSAVDDIDTNGDGFYSAEEYAAAEQAYQNSLGGEPAPIGLPPVVAPDNPPPPPAAEAEEPEKVNDFASLAIGLGQGATFNFGDELLAGVATINPFNPTSAWRSGKGLGGSFDEIVENYRATEAQAAEEDPFLYYGGQVAGSFAVPALGAGRVAVGALSGAQKMKAAAAAGAASGALAGAGADTGNPLERLDGAAVGGAIGGTAGAALSGLGHAISRDRRIQRWVDNQLRTNPNAAMDAEIVADLVAARNSTARSPTDPQGRAMLTAREINDVQDSYLDSTRRMIQALDLPPSEKNRLIIALEQKYSVPQDQLDALRGTVEGNAVADGIMRTQRLRALTPELKSSAQGPLRRLTELSSIVGGGLAGGPAGSGVAYGLTRYALSRVSNGEASRAIAGDILLDRADFYRAITDRVGGSTSRTARDELILAYNQAMDADYAKRKLSQSEEADQALFNNSFPLSSFSTVNPATRRLAADDPMDMALRASDASRSSTVRQARGVATDSSSALAQFQRRLNELDPPAARQRATRPNPVNQATETNIAAGIPGSTRTQQVFADMVGVPREDMLRALDGVESRYPELASDINRIRLNYATENRNVGSVLAPAMRRFLEEDGTVARLAAQAQEAQARLSARTAMMNGGTAARATDQPLPLEPTPPAMGTAPEPPPIPTGSQVPPVQEQMPLAPSRAANEQPPIGSPSRTPTTMSPEEERSAAEYYRSLWEQAAADGQENIGLVGSMIDEYDYLASRGYDDFMRGRADTPPQMRQIDRPEQWREGRDRYRAQAQTAIDGLLGDNDVPDQALRILGNAAEQVRDNYRTTESAIQFIDERVLPDLEMEGLPAPVINRVRQHLIGVANAKPYRDQAAFDAGTRPNN